MNVDFNDVKTVMRNSGRAIMGSAAAEGDNRAVNAVQQALASPLLNDNDISGAQYVLLNITYGNKEVLMDEITEITDYIQDEAGSTADVIWGHGYDPSLGDKLSVTLIATGFKSNHPISGFEKAPERTVVTLDLEQKNEIKEQLSSPTQSTPFINAVEVKAPIEEPFMKPESKQESVQEEVVSFVAPSLEVPVSKVEEEPVEKKESLELSWQIQEVNNEVPSQAESKKEGVIVHHLEDDSQAKLDLDNQSTRTVLSPEEQQRKTQERMSRIHDLTLKLKKSEGISEFENEPAYVRRNIQLDNSKPSTEESFSRFGLAEEDNKGVLRNNNFLHDNVD
jgi:cell division protein FtsZ